MFLWRDPRRPKDIPQWAYIYLVMELHIDPDSLAGLLWVDRPDFEEDSPVLRFRIYSPDAAPAGTHIIDFLSLDAHPQIVRHQGYRNIRSGKIAVELET